MSEERLPGDRRRLDRRSDSVRLADYTIPELRKAAITAALLLIILLLFAYMVRDVLVGIVAGIVLGAYLVPLNDRLAATTRRPRLSAILTITLMTAPLVAVLTYSWIEISGAAAYLEQNREPVAQRITIALQEVPLIRGVEVQDDLSRLVAAAANRGARVVDEIQQALDILVISIAVFLFTVYYILVDHPQLLGYLHRKVPGRYRQLVDEVAGNIRAVVYGALYATFMTQLLKSGVILTMNVLLEVPLGIVLAIVSFFVGFFPIVGSWAVYIPVSLYLVVFREDVVGGIAMLLVGFLVNTIFLSLYLRPKIAAERSHVLNFYWMFIALITGVYTFGLIGIIIGPVLIGVLKAVFDTVTGDARPAVLRPRPGVGPQRPPAG